MWTAECQALNQEEDPFGFRLLDALVAGWISARGRRWDGARAKLAMASYWASHILPCGSCGILSEHPAQPRWPQALDPEQLLGAVESEISRSRRCGSRPSVNWVAS